MYFALFFAILSTQTFGIMISPNYTDTTHTIAGLGLWQRFSAIWVLLAPNIIALNSTKVK